VKQHQGSKQQEQAQGYKKQSHPATANQRTKQRHSANTGFTCECGAALTGQRGSADHKLHCRGKRHLESLANGASVGKSRGPTTSTEKQKSSLTQPFSKIEPPSSLSIQSLAKACAGILGAAPGFTMPASQLCSTLYRKNASFRNTMTRLGGGKTTVRQKRGVLTY
jgi:hypothetical protein